MRQTNHWHPCLLPDNYQLKLRQDLAGIDAVADSGTSLEPEDTLEREYREEEE